MFILVALQMWLWQQWTGTILQYVWKQVVVMMLLTAVVGYVLEVLEYRFGVEIQVMDFWSR